MSKDKRSAGHTYRRGRLIGTFMFLAAIVGPGFITASADNDAAGITTYSIVGARFGYRLLWVLIPVAISLAVTQEMGARMGLVSGKGLASLIRERFGLQWTTFAMAAMLLANLGTTVAEFSGIAAAAEIVGVGKYVSVPVVAVLVYLLVSRGDYRRVEKVFILSGLLYVAYVASGFLAHPDWPQAAKSMLVPSFSWSKAYVLAAVATIGTTITPWGQFFIQSYIVDKKIGPGKLKVERGDVFFGALVTQVVAFFIIVACAATLYRSGLTDIVEAKDAALALKPLAGRFAFGLFALGLFNASFLGASILPMASAYAVTEAFGWESGVDRPLREAPIFYGLFTFIIVFAAAVVLIPNMPLVGIMFVTSAFNGILLPVILVFSLLLVNDREVMGKYVNSRVFNTVAWATVVGLIVLSLILVGTTLLGYS